MKLSIGKANILRQVIQSRWEAKFMLDIRCATGELTAYILYFGQKNPVTTHSKSPQLMQN